MAGEILRRIELQRVGRAAFGEAQHVRRRVEHRIGGATIEGDPGEVERVTGDKAEYRVGRHRGVVDDQLAAETGEGDRAAGNRPGLQLDLAAIDRDIDRGAAIGDILDAAAVDHGADGAAASLDDLDAIDGRAAGGAGDAL